MKWLCALLLVVVSSVALAGPEGTWTRALHRPSRDFNITIELRRGGEVRIRYRKERDAESSESGRWSERRGEVRLDVPSGDWRLRWDKDVMLATDWPKQRFGDETVSLRRTGDSPGNGKTNSSDNNAKALPDSMFAFDPNSRDGVERSLLRMDPGGTAYIEVQYSGELKMVKTGSWTSEGGNRRRLDLLRTDGRAHAVEVWRFTAAPRGWIATDWDRNLLGNSAPYFRNDRAGAPVVPPTINPNPKPLDRTFEGVITWREKIAVPEGAKYIVEVRDTASGELIHLGQGAIRSVPSKFAVRFDVNRLLPGRRYGLSVRVVLSNGGVFFRSASAMAVNRDGWVGTPTFTLVRA